MTKEELRDKAKRLDTWNLQAGGITVSHPTFDKFCKGKSVSVKSIKIIAQMLGETLDTHDNDA